MQFGTVHHMAETAIGLLSMSIPPAVAVVSVGGWEGVHDPTN